MTGRCALCGAVGPVHRHHLTGRPAPGAAYFDGALTLAVCRTCHANIHQALRASALDFPCSSGDFLVHRLRRTALTAELLGGSGRPLVLEPSSASGLAGLLREVAP